MRLQLSHSLCRFPIGVSKRWAQDRAITLLFSHFPSSLSLSLSTSSFIWYDAAECLYISSLLREHVSLTFSLTKEMTSIRVLKPMLRDAAHATTTFTRKSSAVDVDETAVRPWWAFQGERLDIDAVRAFSSSIYSARCYCYYRSQIHKCTQTERILCRWVVCVIASINISVYRPKVLEDGHLIGNTLVTFESGSRKTGPSDDVVPELLNLCLIYEERERDKIYLTWTHETVYYGGKNKSRPLRVAESQKYLYFIFRKRRTRGRWSVVHEKEKGNMSAIEKDSPQMLLLLPCFSSRFGKLEVTCSALQRLFLFYLVRFTTGKVRRIDKSKLVVATRYIRRCWPKEEKKKTTRQK